MCAMCMPGAHGSQKEMLFSMELELRMVVRCYIGAENQTWDLWKIYSYMSGRHIDNTVILYCTHTI